MTVRDEITAWLAGRAATVVDDGGDLAAMADRLAAAQDLGAAAFAAEIIDLARILGESAKAATAFRALLVTGEFEEDVARETVMILSAASAALRWRDRSRRDQASSPWTGSGPAA